MASDTGLSAARASGPIDAGPVGDYVEGVVRLVPAGRHEIGVVRWANRFYAVLNRCPHARGPLCLGRVGPQVQAGDGLGSIAVDGSRPVITCPWHGWEFELASGCATTDPRLRVRTYRTFVENKQVYIDPTTSIEADKEAL